MIARSRGSIDTMGSIAAHSGGTGAAHYASAKGAIHTFTRALAKEVAEAGIRVNAVSPGLIGTRFHDRFSTPGKREATVAQTPLRREGTPADVAAACLYLTSDAASFVTGEVLEVNGGIGMY
jgi:3-oxoacyl-[acyl-carrier protein] reductase